MADNTNTEIIDENPSLEEEAKAQGVSIEINSPEEGEENNTLELNTNEELSDTSEEEGTKEEVAVPDDPPETKELSEQIETSDNTLVKAKEDLEAKGINFDEIVQEYETNGSVSEKTIELLEKNGYPKAVIDVYIQSRQAIDQQFVNEVYRMAGGEEEYAKVMSWASGNLPKGTSTAFNRALDTNDVNSISLMLEGIKARMVATQGTANPSIYGATTAPTASPKGFTTKTEMVKAMSDKRYGIDSKYTHSIEERMLYTKF